MSPVLSAKAETRRLFKSNFLEAFTRVHWSVPLFLFLPLIGFCFYQSLHYPTKNLGVFFRVVLYGFISWTLFEYLFHRFIFHFKPKKPFFKKTWYLVHEVHHEYPSDPLRLVMPPVMSLALSLLAYAVIRSILPKPLFFPFVIGFAAGYLCYDMIHYSVHHRPLKGRLGAYLKQNHLRHHFQEEDRGFGVSSPLWDYVFKTTFRKEIKSKA